MCAGASRVGSCLPVVTLGYLCTSVSTKSLTSEAVSQAFLNLSAVLDLQPVS